MARSYMRSKGRNSKGIRVRENPITPAVNLNSLYCLPATATAVATPTGQVSILKKAGTGLKNGDNYLVESGVVRTSSIKLSSQAPFKVYVKNASQGWTVYQCPGQKVCKLSLNKVTSIAGSPALFAGLSSGANQDLIKIGYNEEPVDITFAIVVDSAID